MGLVGLSLAVAVALVESLERIGITGVAIKWPNDLFWQGRKLGGILVEVGGENSGPCHAVVGIGLNVRIPASIGEGIDQPWTDLAAIGCDLGRNAICGTILEGQFCALERFASMGPAPFLERWSRYDALVGHRVTVRGPREYREGVAVGIDCDGALLLEEGGHIVRVTAGEVSVRPACEPR